MDVEESASHEEAVPGLPTVPVIVGEFQEDRVGAHWLQVNRQYPNTRQINADPPAFLVEDFLTPAEALGLIRAGAPGLGRSIVVDGVAGKSPAPSRTSESCYLLKEDVAWLHERIAKLIDKPVATHEPPQIARYLQSQFYMPHFDAFDITTGPGLECVRTGGQRVATVLIYLNSVASGGSTSFPKIPLQVAPRMGSALVFFPCTTDGKLDTLALHSADPAVEEKWPIDEEMSSLFKRLFARRDDQQAALFAAEVRLAKYEAVLSRELRRWESMPAQRAASLTKVREQQTKKLMLLYSWALVDLLDTFFKQGVLLMKREWMRCLIDTAAVSALHEKLEATRAWRRRLLFMAEDRAAGSATSHSTSRGSGAGGDGAESSERSPPASSASAQPFDEAAFVVAPAELVKDLSSIKKLHRRIGRINEKLAEIDLHVQTLKSLFRPLPKADRRVLLLGLLATQSHTEVAEVAAEADIGELVAAFRDQMRAGIVGSAASEPAPSLAGAPGAVSGPSIHHTEAALLPPLGAADAPRGTRRRTLRRAASALSAVPPLLLLRSPRSWMQMGASHSFSAELHTAADWGGSGGAPTPSSPAASLYSSALPAPSTAISSGPVFVPQLLHSTHPCARWMYLLLLCRGGEVLEGAPTRLRDGSRRAVTFANRNNPFSAVPVAAGAAAAGSAVTLTFGDADDARAAASSSGGGVGAAGGETHRVNLMAGKHAQKGIRGSHAYAAGTISSTTAAAAAAGSHFSSPAPITAIVSRATAAAASGSAVTSGVGRFLRHSLLPDAVGGGGVGAGAASFRSSSRELRHASQAAADAYSALDTRGHGVSSHASSTPATEAPLPEALDPLVEVGEDAAAFEPEPLPLADPLASVFILYTYGIALPADVASAALACGADPDAVLAASLGLEEALGAAGSSSVVQECETQLVAARLGLPLATYVCMRRLHESLWSHRKLRTSSLAHTRDAFRIIADQRTLEGRLLQRWCQRVLADGLDPRDEYAHGMARFLSFDPGPAYAERLALALAVIQQPASAMHASAPPASLSRSPAAAAAGPSLSSSAESFSPFSAVLRAHYEGAAYAAAATGAGRGGATELSRKWRVPTPRTIAAFLRYYTAAVASEYDLLTAAAAVSVEGPPAPLATGHRSSRTTASAAAGVQAATGPMRHSNVPSGHAIAAGAEAMRLLRKYVDRVALPRLHALIFSGIDVVTPGMRAGEPMRGEDEPPPGPSASNPPSGGAIPPVAGLQREAPAGEDEEEPPSMLSDPTVIHIPQAVAAMLFRWGRGGGEGRDAAERAVLEEPVAGARQAADSQEGLLRSTTVDAVSIALRATFSPLPPVAGAPVTLISPRARSMSAIMEASEAAAGAAQEIRAAFELSRGAVLGGTGALQQLRQQAEDALTLAGRRPSASQEPGELSGGRFAGATAPSGPSRTRSFSLTHSLHRGVATGLKTVQSNISKAALRMRGGASFSAAQAEGDDDAGPASSLVVTSSTQVPLEELMEGIYEATQLLHLTHGAHSLSLIEGLNGAAVYASGPSSAAPSAQSAGAAASSYASPATAASVPRPILLPQPGEEGLPSPPFAPGLASSASSAPVSGSPDSFTTVALNIVTLGERDPGGRGGSSGQGAPHSQRPSLFQLGSGGEGGQPSPSPADSARTHPLSAPGRNAASAPATAAPAPPAPAHAPHYPAVQPIRPPGSAADLMLRRDHIWTRKRGLAAAMGPAEMGIPPALMTPLPSDVLMVPLVPASPAGSPGATDLTLVRYDHAPYSIPSQLLSCIDDLDMPAEMLAYLHAAIEATLAEATARGAAAAAAAAGPSSLPRAQSAPSSSSSSVAADDLIPLMSFVCSRSGWARPHACLSFLANYGVDVSASAGGRDAYMITLIQSCVAWICTRSGPQGEVKQQQQQRRHAAAAGGQGHQVPGAPAAAATSAAPQGLASAPAAQAMSGGVHAEPEVFSDDEGGGDDEEGEGEDGKEETVERDPASNDPSGGAGSSGSAPGGGAVAGGHLDPLQTMSVDTGLARLREVSLVGADLRAVQAELLQAQQREEEERGGSLTEPSRASTTPSFVGDGGALGSGVVPSGPASRRIVVTGAAAAAATVVVASSPAAPVEVGDSLGEDDDDDARVYSDLLAEEETFAKDDVAHLRLFLADQEAIERTLQIFG